MKRIMLVVFYILGMMILTECRATTSSKNATAYTVEGARKDFQKNSSEGKLYLLTYGEESPEPQIDKETGLPIETLGCVVMEGEQEYINEYNRLMREFVKKN